MEEGEVIANKMHVELKANLLDQKKLNYGIINENELIKKLNKSIKKYLPRVLEKEKGDAIRQELKI